MANESDKPVVLDPTPTVSRLSDRSLAQAPERTLINLPAAVWGQKLGFMNQTLWVGAGLALSLGAGMALGSSTWSYWASIPFHLVVGVLAAWVFRRWRGVKVVVTKEGILIVETVLGVPVRRTAHRLDAAIGRWERKELNYLRDTSPYSQDVHEEITVRGISIDGTQVANVEPDQLDQLRLAIGRARIAAGPGSVSLASGSSEAGALSPLDQGSVSEPNKGEGPP